MNKISQWAAIFVLGCSVSIAQTHGTGTHSGQQTGDQKAGHAGMHGDSQNKNWNNKQNTAMNQNPKNMEDDSWLRLSGKAVNTSKDEFKLDYGEGTINVEMDGSDWYAEQHRELEGKRVTVYGRVDDDWLQAAEIDASSVYAPSLNSYFYGDSDDRYDRNDIFFDFGFDSDLQYDNITLVGTVTGINGDEFTLDRGKRQITVETDELNYDPFDEDQFQRIQVGDRVKVSGNLDDGLFQDRELIADWIVTLDRQQDWQNRNNEQTMNNEQNRQGTGQ